MIFDIAVDPVPVPERVVPSPQIAAAGAPAPAEPRPVKAGAPIGPPNAAGREGVLDIAHLAMVDAIAELHDHVRALRVARGAIAARLELLRDDAGVALELEAAVARHAAVGDDIECLALRRRHRLVA